MPSSTKKFAVTVAAVLALGVTPLTASAGFVLSPGSVIANTMGEAPGASVNQLLNQSGLSVGYTSGVTDFATYIASGPTHTRAVQADQWFSSIGTFPPGHIDFDLGNEYMVRDLAFWNGAGTTTANVQNFRVFTSNVPDFSVSTLVGSFTNPQQRSSNTYPVTVFHLTNTDARYVRLDLDTYYGNPNVVGIGEVAFDATSATAAAPEPASLTLLGIGSIGLLGYGWRRRKQSAS
jgi:hypothetical protein